MGIAYWLNVLLSPKLWRYFLIGTINQIIPFWILTFQSFKRADYLKMHNPYIIENEFARFIVSPYPRNCGITVLNTFKHRGKDFTKDLKDIKRLFMSFKETRSILLSEVYECTITASNYPMRTLVRYIGFKETYRFRNFNSGNICIKYIYKC